MWQYPTFKPSEKAYWKPSKFNNISLILGIGYGFCFNCLFRLLNSLRKQTRFDLGLGWAKYEARHSESFSNSKTPNRTKCQTYFLRISSCTFGTGYGWDQIGVTFSFNSNSTRYVFQVPIVPSKNSLNLCNNFSN